LRLVGWVEGGDSFTFSIDSSGSPSDYSLSIVERTSASPLSLTMSLMARSLAAGRASDLSGVLMPVAGYVQVCEAEVGSD
jgi:hypothetical protein